MIRHILIACLLVALVHDLAVAGGTCSGVKGGCGRGRSRSSYSTSSSSGGTVHVRGYTRKDGTYVRPHTRRAPGTASHDYAPARAEPVEATEPGRPLITYRTSARTSARTHAWSGNVTDTGEPEPSELAPVIKEDPLPVKYFVYFTSGKFTKIGDYKRDGEFYILYGTDWKSTRYEERDIERIEPLPVPPKPAVEEPPNPDLRTWTSSGGGFSITAEFLSFANGMMKLRKLDGDVVTINLDKLSEADKLWLLARRDRRR